MPTAVMTIFALELALLFTHEMDAIRRHEWKMFIGLNKMADETAYRIFLLLHIPLYALALLLLFSPFSLVGYYVVDIFLLAHMLIHLAFKNHPANQLDGIISKTIINAAGLLAVVHLIAISWSR